MTLQLINPEDLPVPSTYTQVVVATGTRMVFRSRSTSFTTGPSTCRSSSRPDNTCSASTSPADTVVGVETLAGPGYLIEVDAIAVTDH